METGGASESPDRWVVWRYPPRAGYAQGSSGEFRSLSQCLWDEGREAEMEKCPFKNQWKCHALGAGLCLEIAAVSGGAAEAPIIVLFFSPFLCLSPAALQ